jgi:hypothetical protein
MMDTKPDCTFTAARSDTGISDIDSPLAALEVHQEKETRRHSLLDQGPVPV